MITPLTSTPLQGEVAMESDSPRPKYTEISNDNSNETSSSSRSSTDTNINKQQRGHRSTVKRYRRRSTRHIKSYCGERAIVMGNVARVPCTVLTYYDIAHMGNCVIPKDEDMVLTHLDGKIITGPTVRQ